MPIPIQILIPIQCNRMTRKKSARSALQKPLAEVGNVVSFNLYLLWLTWPDDG